MKVAGVASPPFVTPAIPPNCLFEAVFCYSDLAMAILPIHQNGDLVLRQRALQVPESLFDTPELRAMLITMTETLDNERDGVALAAPQVGILYRIFVVRYDRMTDSKKASTETSANIGVFINPTFIKASRRQIEMPEGCLSVRRLYGTTLRHERITIKAQDEHGQWFTRGAGGILAQAFQHETDHLDGMLFIDHAEDIYEQAATVQHDEPK